MADRTRVQTDWMNDPKNATIVILLVIVGLFTAASLRGVLPAGFATLRAERTEGDPVIVLDVILDRESLRSVDFLFDRPVGEGRVGEILDVDPATVRPPLAGVWRWQGANVLRFEPAGGFGMAMRHDVALVQERVLPDGAFLAGRDTFEIVTDQFRVERVDTAQEPTGEGSEIQVRGQVTFNYDVDPEALIARMRLVDPASREPIPLRMESYYPQRVVGFHSDPLTKLPEARELRLVIDPGLTPAQGNVGLIAGFEQPIPVGSSENLAVQGVETRPGDPRSELVVRLSSPVDAARAAPYLQVSPAVDFRATSRGNELVLSGEFVPGSRYELQLGAGLPARDRAVLRESWSEAIFLPDLDPRVEFAAQGMFLSASGNRALEVESVNVAEARLVIERVYANNLFYLFDSYSWMVWNQETWAGNAVAHSLGDRLVDTSLALSTPRNRVRRTPIDLDAWIDTDSPGLYRVVLAEADSYEAVQRWVLVTDIGLVAKRGESDLLVWASSFADLTPVAGARIRVVSDQNQVIDEGSTDGRGLLHLRDLRDDAGRPWLLLAERGDETSFLLLDSMQVDMTGLDVDGAGTSPSGYQAFLYGERDIYRPGETVEGVALVRERGLSVPPAMPLRMRHRDPTGIERAAFRVDLEAEGMAPFELEVPDYDRTGGHVLELLAGDEVIGSYGFQVEEFVPDRIRVDIEVEDRPVHAGEALELLVRGTYLFGPPAAELPVETRVRLESRVFAPEGFEAYSFTHSERGFTPTELSEREGRLTPDGTAQVRVPLPEGLRVPSSLQAVATARVQEEGGRGVLARRAVPVHPYSHYVGLRRTGSDYAEPGMAERFEFVVLSPGGDPVAPRALRAELFRDEWQTVLRRTPAGTFRYESTRDSRLVQALDLDAASDGAFDLAAPEMGAYRVVLSDPLAGPAAEMEFTASGFGYSPWAVENPARVELALDRDEYRPGDRARVQVRAPFAGRLLLTVERDGVSETLVSRMEGNTATLEIPVSAAMRPNGYVTATVVRSAAALGADGVGRAFGAVPLYVDRAANRIDVALEHPEQMRADRPLEITVQSDPGVALTVAAVDEGILQLIGQPTPDPFEFFYRKLRLAVGAFDTFSLLFPEVDLEAASAAGGGSMGDAAQFVQTDGIRRVRPVAFWSGVLQTDDAGRAVVRFEVPEFQGALRVMVVAADGRRFGSASSQVRVRDPLVLLPTLPRFLGTGDRARVAVGVRNDTGSDAAVEVTLEADAPDGSRSTAGEQTRVPDGAQRTVYLPLEAPPDTGALEVAVRAAGGGETSRSLTTIPVREGLPIVSDETVGQLTERVTRLPALDASRFRSADRSLRVGSTPLLQVSAPLRWLLRYPYGCLEQVTSSAFPLVWLGELAREIDPETFRDGPEPAGLVQQAIRRVGAYQTFSGAFTLWPGGDEVQPWATVYATHFLVEARRAGFLVPQNVYGSALEYLRGETRMTDEPGQLQLQRSAYALYVLARAGQAEVGTMDLIRQRHRPELRPESRALLGAAYAAAGNPAAVEEMIARLEQVEAMERQSGGNFNSTLRNRALVLMALLDAAPGDARIPDLARRLARDLSAGGLLNTQEAAFALLALGQLQRGAAGGEAPLAGRVLVDDAEVGRFGAEPTVFDDLGRGEVRIELDEGVVPGAGWYTLQTRGVPTEEAFEPSSEGLEARRTWLSRGGDPIDLRQVRQGDLVVVRLQIRSTSGALENVVIQNLLPAGFEVENPRLGSSETVPWIADASLVADHLDLRDDRILLFVSLPADEWRTGYALVRAVTPGTFRVPPLRAEAMYEPRIRVTTGRQTLTVSER